MCCILIINFPIQNWNPMRQKVETECCNEPYQKLEWYFTRLSCFAQDDLVEDDDVRLECCPWAALLRPKVRFTNLLYQCFKKLDRFKYEENNIYISKHFSFVSKEVAKNGEFQTSSQVTSKLSFCDADSFNLCGFNVNDRIGLFFFFFFFLMGSPIRSVILMAVLNIVRTGLIFSRLKKFGKFESY